MMRYIVGRRSLGTPAEQDRIGEAASATADEGARLVEPARLLASDPALSSTMRGLLQSPPPVKPLDAHVAMRVRGAVLQSPNGPVGPTKAASGPSTQPAALAKLGAIAGGAALFGAGVMTLVSSYLTSPPSHYGPVTNGSVVVVSNPNAASNLDVVRAGTDGTVTLGPLPHVPYAQATTGAMERGMAVDSSIAVDRGIAMHGSIGANRSLLSDSVSSNGATSDRSVIAPLDPTTSGLTSAAHEHSSAPDAARGSIADSRESASLDKIVSVDDLASVDDALFRSSTQGTADDTRVLVRPAFRRIASTARDHAGKAPPRTLSSLEEETSLLEEARSKLGREPERALTLALQHQSRFRNGQLLEQRRMIHLEALLRLGRDSEALELAKTIDGSLYRTRARALLTKYGI